MRLAYYPWTLSVEVEEGKPLSLVIESGAMLVEFISALKEAFNGNDTDIIISINERELKLSKESILIVDPWDVDCSSKQIKAKLYQELCDVAKQFGEKEFLSLRADVLQYVDTILEHITYPTSYNIDMDQLSVFKMLDVGINTREVEFFEKLISYIKILQSLCGIKVIFFVNISLYLSAEQLRQLYAECRYVKVYLVLVESRNGASI